MFELYSAKSMFLYPLLAGYAEIILSQI